MVTSTPPAVCEGPLVWFDVAASGHESTAAAILECATCDYVITTGNFNDEAHQDTPLLRSPT